MFKAWVSRRVQASSLRVKSTIMVNKLERILDKQESLLCSLAPSTKEWRLTLSQVNTWILIDLVPAKTCFSTSSLKRFRRSTHRQERKKAPIRSWTSLISISTSSLLIKSKVTKRRMFQMRIKRNTWLKRNPPSWSKLKKTKFKKTCKLPILDSKIEWFQD